MEYTRANEKCNTFPPCFDAIHLANSKKNTTSLGRQNTVVVKTKSPKNSASIWVCDLSHLPCGWVGTCLHSRCVHKSSKASTRMCLLACVSLCVPTNISTKVTMKATTKTSSLSKEFPEDSRGCDLALSLACVCLCSRVTRFYLSSFITLVSLFTAADSPARQHVHWAPTTFWPWHHPDSSNGLNKGQESGTRRSRLNVI